jgi:hypothetical protein
MHGIRMAKRKNTTPGRGLFDEQTRVQERRIRRQRALFIPRLLTEAASSKLLDDEARDRAYQIALDWADLETKGYVSGFRETAVDTQFLDQFFRDGLGYQLKTTSPSNWQLEHKYSVAGVGMADAALGNFPQTEYPIVLIELKDSSTDLDRDRSNGRTAVQQCWDYLNAIPSCTWGIVSNFSTIRLYHRSKGTLAYEEFSLQELRKRDRFNEFYCLFERGGLLPSAAQAVPRAVSLLERTQARQQVVGDELYESYQIQRLRLIEHLNQEQGKDFDVAIHIAQKLLDRIIFIAFCEDRDLLKEKCLDRAWRELPPFTKAKNPRWQNFLALFEQVDSGGDHAGVTQGYNGLLFKHDAELDTLKLPDDPWTNGFRSIGNFDFTEEVSVEVLGHLFERSVTELEKLRVGGLFALKANIVEQDPIRDYGRKKTKKVKAAEERLTTKMPKSAQRKRFGIYYTPPAFTGLIVERTLDVVVEERFRELQEKHHVNPEERKDQDLKKLNAYWNDCLEALKSLTVCDPACGSGAFLIRAYDALDAHYKTVVHGLAGSGLDAVEVEALEDSIPDFILKQNLYGVDLSEQAVEISQLALWIRSARKNRKLSDLSKNIVWGNSLVADAGVDPKAIDWRKTFPTVFGKDTAGGFTCVIGNPPWERVKVQDREFFSLTDPITAGAVNAGDRKKRIAAMPKANPELHASYLVARDRAQSMLDYARGSKRYPLTGRGDVNLYMLFAELANSLVGESGYVGLLVPSGIATDDTTKDFFSSLMDSQRLVSLYDFENRNKVFEDVDGRFKFSAIIFGGTQRRVEHADFVFFAHSVEDTSAVKKQRHIALTAKDLSLLNPNTKTCPIFRTRRDAELTKSVYQHIPILIDHQRVKGGNPWAVTFFTMFHQTNDAEHFHPAKVWEKRGYKLQGNMYTKMKKRALPLYEAKMVQAFDHRAASVLVAEANWVRQGQKVATSPVQHQNPEFCLTPRWWVDESVVAKAILDRPREWLLAYKDVTSSTNERTMIATFLPTVAVVNSAPLMFTGESITPRRQACLVANLNSFAYDYVARQKVGGNHLNFFIVEQLPTLRPDTYDDKCPWAKRETLERWISERVLKLSCTSEDMRPLAAACQFDGSRGDGVHIWKEAERAILRAELDAAYFHLYGIERDDVEYILGTFTNTGMLPAEQRSAQQSLWSRGSTGEMILEAYERLSSR